VLIASSIRHKWAGHLRCVGSENLQSNLQNLVCPSDQRVFWANFRNEGSRQCKFPATSPSLPDCAASDSRMHVQSAAPPTFLATAAAAAAAQAAEIAKRSALYGQIRLHEWRRWRVLGLERLKNLFQLAAFAEFPVCRWLKLKNSVQSRKMRRRISAGAESGSVALQRITWELSLIGSKIRKAMLGSVMNPEELMQRTVWWGLGQMKWQNWAANRRRSLVDLTTLHMGPKRVCKNVCGNDLEILWPENWSLLQPQV
jgi:hypothetical protein